MFLLKQTRQTKLSYTIQDEILPKQTVDKRAKAPTLRSAATRFNFPLYARKWQGVAGLSPNNQAFGMRGLEAYYKISPELDGDDR